jgi:hypothetical protein
MPMGITILLQCQQLLVKLAVCGRGGSKCRACKAA